MADEKINDDQTNEATPDEPTQEQKIDEQAEMKEKMLRLAAEFDNYKKRTRKEVDEASLLGKAALVKDMLPVIDEFQLAIIALEKSEDKHMLKGITMLYSNLMDTLKRNGLSEIKCEGRFDPFRHEIVMVKESKEKEGTILEVIGKGYELGGRLIRPASVIVATPEKKKNGD